MNTDRVDFERRLAAITPETRRNLEALYGEHLDQRRDGGSDFTLDDQLWQTYGFNGHEQELAKASQLPRNYFLTMRAALGLGEEKNETS